MAQGACFPGMVAGDSLPQRDLQQKQPKTRFIAGYASLCKRKWDYCKYSILIYIHSNKMQYILEYSKYVGKLKPARFQYPHIRILPQKSAKSLNNTKRMPKCSIKRGHRLPRPPTSREPSTILTASRLNVIALPRVDLSAFTVIESFR